MLAEATQPGFASSADKRLSSWPVRRQRQQFAASETGLRIMSIEQSIVRLEAKLDTSASHDAKEIGHLQHKRIGQIEAKFDNVALRLQMLAKIFVFMDWDGRRWSRSSNLLLMSSLWIREVVHLDWKQRLLAMERRLPMHPIHHQA